MPTYATLDPANKSANITLSGGNLIATNSTATWDSAKSTIGKSSGKWYWEMTVNTVGSGQFAGVGLTGDSNATYSGTGTNSYSYLSINGNKYNNNTPVAYGSTFTSADVIGVALNMDVGEVTFYKNNVSQGVAYTGITGTQFAMPTSNASGSQFTMNFGATALTYSPPAGFNAGLYNPAATSSSFFIHM